MSETVKTPRRVSQLAANAAEVYYNKTMRQLTPEERDLVFEVAWDTYSSQEG